MTLPKTKFREIVFLALFSREGDPTEMLMHQLKMSRSKIREGSLYAQSVLEKFEELDSKIREFSQEYEFERICDVEKNLLRLALYEIFFDEEVPTKVAISEAIRLTKKFGSKEGGSFVNAVLDSISCGNEALV